MQQKCLHIYSRSVAIERGFTKYCTYRLCRRGHFEESRVSSSACIECCTINAKRYAAENPERIASHRKALSASGYFAEYYRENRERRIQESTQWGKDNPEKFKKNAKASRDRNSEKIKQRVTAYRKANPEKSRQNVRNRRAARKLAGGVCTPADIAKIYEAQKGKCADCKKSVGKIYHADHIMPLARGGSNWPSNIQILCPRCNLTKNAHDPIDWAQKNGRLL